MGKKTVVHNANANLVKELYVPSDADDSAIQEALLRLFHAQTRDQAESNVVEGQASKAKRSVEDQALKASDSVLDQFHLDQLEPNSKNPRSI